MNSPNSTKRTETESNRHMKRPEKQTIEVLKEELQPPDPDTIKRVWKYLEAEGYVIGLSSDARSQALQDADDQLRQILENHKTK